MGADLGPTRLAQDRGTHRGCHSPALHKVPPGAQRFPYVRKLLASSRPPLVRSIPEDIETAASPVQGRSGHWSIPPKWRPARGSWRGGGEGLGHWAA